ncbi:SpoIIE family protein phosphatase [uncultured Jatrophihabitans sp.]|uniref:SpoIIE family protein phosphatase n=1 Tax=uncultured Jatrophihabitans sp. TaxID=1610747 RepID=UPI0035CAF04E
MSGGLGQERGTRAVGTGLGGHPSVEDDPRFVPLGTPIDLDNCAREPIHIPGSVQPRGVLAVVREPELVVSQVSANVSELLGREVDDVVAHGIGAAFGTQFGSILERVTAAFGDLRERNPIEIQIDVRGQPVMFDAILHRSDSALLVEFEPAEGPRPFSFPNTYQAARSAVGDLNRAASLQELYDVTAQSVRTLTGFDRVMVYRYDHEYNGEVVAEARREDLNSFLGQHYPASDIPPQARALYEKNWIRLISDVDYAPAPLVPTVDPVTGEPQDLTFSSLRSVSPIHVEYLQNMGVRASMSISLLRDGKLWGLIACHHYSSTHTPPYGVRAAAEFLGSTLSLRLFDQAEDDELRLRLAAQAVLAKLTAATMNESEPVLEGLFGAPDLLDLVPADGVVAYVRGETRAQGDVPPDAVVRALSTWARSVGDEVVWTDSLANSGLDAEVDVEPSVVSGVLAVNLPDGQYILWVRKEYAHSIDWGGDPRNKAIAEREGNHVRLSPRKSFERWREVVRGRSVAWLGNETSIAGDLRHHLVESLYARMRSESRLAETLQRSLLPQMPVVSGWHLTAHYEPAAGGRIGGDWYDAVVLRDGLLAVVLGDVAGHGIGAAGTMAQLRNALRAYLLDGTGPAQAVERLNGFAIDMLPGAFATLTVACIDPGTGHAQGVVAGHPRPYLVSDESGTPVGVPVVTSPPIGVRGATYRSREFAIPAGGGVILYSDGLIERRDEDIDESLHRVGDLIAGLSPRPAARQIFSSVGRSTITDDATVLALYRTGEA